MSKIMCLTILLLTVYTIQSRDCSDDLQRLPSYLGRGYDILQGNPLSNSIDPGFKYEVIALDYTTKKTEDNKFLVADKISFQKAQSCSLKSDVNEYRGTKSYQDELKLMVKASSGAEINGFGGSFSRSIGWRDLANKIQKQQTVVYQAIAECWNYVLALDRYQAYKVSTNFFKAMQLSMQQNNWGAFFSQYGTHYISEVTMGGRAVQQSEFSRTSVTQLKQRGIDLSMGAKFTFAGVFGQLETNNSWTNTQKKQYESSRKKISNFYIGGKPPTNGNINTWQQQVNSDPMPIRYKISLNSDLFVLSKFPKQWVQKAKASYVNGIKDYCAKQGCTNPTPDRDLPKRKAQLSCSSGSSYGGNGGNGYGWSTRQPGWHITKVTGRCGLQIDAIQVEASSPDGGSRTSSGYYGRYGGQYFEYSIPADDYITQIEVRAGFRVDFLRFRTKKGNSSKGFGGEGGDYYIFDIPEGFRWTGILGKAGARLDQIMFIYCKTTYIFGEHHQVQTKYHEINLKREE